MIVSHKAVVWLSVAGMLALALASLANVALIEFGPLREWEIAVDELYFVTCAVRGLASGEVPISGCHDTKTPMVLLVHQLVQWGRVPYDLVAMKSVAFAIVAAVVGLVALAAHRLGGGLSAVIAAALSAQVFAADAYLPALKTETVGMVFVLLGLLVLIGAGGAERLARLFVAGLMFGLAVATKQTFALAAMAAFVWFALATQGSLAQRLRWVVQRGAAFWLGVAVPFMVFLGLFYLQNKHVEFLATVLLNPTVYGNASVQDLPALKRLAWSLGFQLTTMASTPLLSVAFAVAVIDMLLRGLDRSRRGELPWRSPLMLVIMMAAVMLLLMMLVQPVMLTYHYLPAWILMAVVSGVVLARLIDTSTPPPLGAALAAGLLMSSVLMAGTSWYTSGGKKGAVQSSGAKGMVPSVPGEFAYVLGAWPAFYVHNSLVPATDVLYAPWSLPKLPPSWALVLPDPASRQGQALAYVHARNLQTLFADFKKTPPRYLVVVDSQARASSSSRITDVPGFDEYIQLHCQPFRTFGEDAMTRGRVFRCDTGRVGAATAEQ